MCKLWVGGRYCQDIINRTHALDYFQVQKYICKDTQGNASLMVTLQGTYFYTGMGANQ